MKEGEATLNILYIAFSCQPNKGSEEKIGWNIPLESSKTNKVFVITREEQRPKIEEYVKEHDLKNIKFYYVDIHPIYKKLFKGSMLSLKLNILHKKAYPLAKEICQKERIDIIHQITPIEFRSIGKYYKIPKVRFVCGPMGGGEYVPSGLRKYALSNTHIEVIRHILNSFCKLKYSLSKQLLNCDYFFFANRETQQYMNKLIGTVPNELYFDNGISEDELSEIKKVHKNVGDKLVFLSAGRLAYRKGHRFLLDVIKRVPLDVNCEFRFVGTGPELKRLKRICKKHGLDNRVVFTGRISYMEMKDEYERADVFIMPSIRETTGAVLLESASKGVPVIAINRFGAPVLFDNEAAFLYRGNNTKEYIEALETEILNCIKQPSDIQIKAQNARAMVLQHIWDNKVEKYNNVYKKLLGQ